MATALAWAHQIVQSAHVRREKRAGRTDNQRGALIPSIAFLEPEPELRVQLNPVFDPQATEVWATVVDRSGKAVAAGNVPVERPPSWSEYKAPPEYWSHNLFVWQPPEEHHGQVQMAALSLGVIGPKLIPKWGGTVAVGIEDGAAESLFTAADSQVTARVIQDTLLEDASTLTFFRGTTLGSASEVVEAQAFDVTRILENQIHNGHPLSRQGVFISSQESAARFFADLAGTRGRGLGPAVLRIEVPAGEFNTFARKFNIPVEEATPRPPFPGATETLLPFGSVNEFERFARFFLLD